MDSLITAAARALAAGDPLGALKHVALREDPPALALRGIAMAQLGELGRSRELLKSAARAFGAREPLAKARCVVAEAEVALASRDLSSSERALELACEALEERGDRINATHGRLTLIRRLLLLGKIDAADRALTGLDFDHPMLAAIAELCRAEIAVRRLQSTSAREALDRASTAAHRARIPALISEIDRAIALLAAPAARLCTNGTERAIALEEVECVLASDSMIVDACRRAIRHGDRIVKLARRPVLFQLALILAEASPQDVPRELLVTRLFDVRRGNESHRARLRVEVGRLRKELRGLAELRATPGGFVLDAQLAILLPPIDGEHAALLALLADGESWSTSALALALGSSQRSVQRALATLEEEGRVRSLGKARAKRWLGRPLAGFTTVLLLSTSPPIG